MQEQTKKALQQEKLKILQEEKKAWEDLAKMSRWRPKGRD
jgi:hypothetical protein